MCLFRSNLPEGQASAASGALCAWHFRPTLAGFRVAAREALRQELPPHALLWVADTNYRAPAGSATASNLRVNRTFMQDADFAVRYAADDRWDLLYRMLWRLSHDEPHLLSMHSDPCVVKFTRYVQGVRRELHKMKAFVRFKEIDWIPGTQRYVAWFEPEHDVLALAAKFFVRRLSNMNWSVLTPNGCAHWDCPPARESACDSGNSSAKGVLSFSPGISRPERLDDPTDALWRTYFRHTFNPARIKFNAMRSEMPQKYWKNLPEAQDISELILRADSRLHEMLTHSPRSEAKLNCGPRPGKLSSA